MQSFNNTIQSNWALAALFVGVLPATVAAAVLDHRSGRGAAARWAAYAAVLYLVALLVTAGFNIPMNSDLAAAGNPSTMTDFAIVDRFKTSWVAANALRAALCAVALGALTRALVLHGRSDAAARPLGDAAAVGGFDEDPSTASVDEISKVTNKWPSMRTSSSTELRRVRQGVCGC
ncbi:anthrone oxygenase family protein [Streptomyces sp. NPDC056500]|uniref:anthrone oxygenase family protein n=1 Tax=Streptomyces sp. NPDC056500 TaxID=3345840 RepID=UPI0036BF7298